MLSSGSSSDEYAENSPYVEGLSEDEMLNSGANRIASRYALCIQFLWLKCTEERHLGYSCLGLL